MPLLHELSFPARSEDKLSGQIHAKTNGIASRAATGLLAASMLLEPFIRLQHRVTYIDGRMSGIVGVAGIGFSEATACQDVGIQLDDVDSVNGRLAGNRGHGVLLGCR